MNYLESHEYKMMRLFVYIMGSVLILGITFISYIIYDRVMLPANINNQITDNINLNTEIVDIKSLGSDKILIYSLDKIIIYNFYENRILSIINISMHEKV